jgi:hypothetical protein
MTDKPGGRLLDQILGFFGHGDARHEFGSQPVVPSGEFEQLMREAKLGAEMRELTVLLVLELRHQAFVTCVFGADLLRNRSGAIAQIGKDVTHVALPPTLLRRAGESLASELRGCSQHCRHAVELFGQIDSKEQGAGTEALSLRHEQGPVRAVNMDWSDASPRTGRLALKSADKFSFCHDALPSHHLGEERSTNPRCYNTQSRKDMAEPVNETI